MKNLVTQAWQNLYKLLVSCLLEFSQVFVTHFSYGNTYSLHYTSNSIAGGGAWWLSGRASDSRARGCGFETYLLRVVSLSKTLYSPKVLVIPRKRWLRPDMTEKLLTDISLNTNNSIAQSLEKAEHDKLHGL